jgi:FkbM family methyltransferase
MMVDKSNFGNGATGITRPHFKGSAMGLAMEPKFRSQIRTEKIPSLQLLREIENLVEPLRRTAPPTNRRAIVGHLVSAVRALAWRILGLRQSFQGIYTVLCQLAVDSGQEWHFREGTVWDKAIFHEVVAANEYRLPDSFQPEDVIVDIGMHFGSFCYAALSRGSHNVYGYEADQENYDLAVANLRPFGERVHLYHKAVWRSDRRGDILYHPGSSSISNSGGGGVYWPGEHQMDVIAFDDILQEVTQDGKNRVKLVKMDCECAEFPILLTSQKLFLIDNIHGEFHEMNDGKYDSTPIPPVAQVAGVERFTLDELKKCLYRAGFSVTAIRYAEPQYAKFGKFFATREAS